MDAPSLLPQRITRAEMGDDGCQQLDQVLRVGTEPLDALAVGLEAVNRALAAIYGPRGEFRERQGDSDGSV